MRIKGEAYGLRALFLYHLLQTHAGCRKRNKVFPLYWKLHGTNADFNKPRATFDATMKQIFGDLDKADALLPLDYENIAGLH